MVFRYREKKHAFVKDEIRYSISAAAFALHAKREFPALTLKPRLAIVPLHGKHEKTVSIFECPHRRVGSLFVLSPKCFPFSTGAREAEATPAILRTASRVLSR